MILCGLLFLALGGKAQPQPWKFMVFGDTLSYYPDPVNTLILGELARDVVAQQPDFLLFLGDFSLNDTPEELGLWTNAMAPVFNAGIPIYPVIGNHDYLYPDAVSNLFSGKLPSNGPSGELGTTYAVEHRNALVVVLNEFSSGNEYRVNQPWLDAVLATNTRPHIFLAGHMPAFKVYHDDCLNYFPRERDRFWNSLSNADARVYFCGHDHFFDHERLDDGDGQAANDLHQVTVGTGGAPLYPDGLFNGDNGIWTLVRAAHEAQYGSVLVEVDGDKVSCTWRSRAGPDSYVSSPDVFSYVAAPRPLLRHSYRDGRLILAWVGPAVLQVAPDLQSTFTDVPDARAPFVVTDLEAPRSYYRLAFP